MRPGRGSQLPPAKGDGLSGLGGLGVRRRGGAALLYLRLDLRAFAADEETAGNASSSLVRHALRHISPLTGLV
eukprot:SAG11_NODE_3765_length_2240_cov_35.026623_2_plen_73_part_00